jgi:hypothetical protein
MLAVKDGIVPVSAFVERPERCTQSGRCSDLRGHGDALDRLVTPEMER